MRACKAIVPAGVVRHIFAHRTICTPHNRMSRIALLFPITMAIRDRNAYKPFGLLAWHRAPFVFSDSPLMIFLHRRLHQQNDAIGGPHRSWKLRERAR